MTRGANTDLEQRLELMGAELAHAETEIDRTVEALHVARAALRRIANAESGVWGWIARDALDASKVEPGP